MEQFARIADKKTLIKRQRKKIKKVVDIIDFKCYISVTLRLKSNGMIFEN